MKMRNKVLMGVNLILAIALIVKFVINHDSFLFVPIFLNLVSFIGLLFMERDF